MARTNRVGPTNKQTGFLVSYRTSEEEILEAAKEYSGEIGSIKEIEFFCNYEKRLKQANDLVGNILRVAPDYMKIDLIDIKYKIEFVKYMGRFLSIKDILIKYDCFKDTDLKVSNEIQGYYTNEYIRIKDDFKRNVTSNKKDEENEINELYFSVTYKGIINANLICELVRGVRNEND
jgi:type I site-specific restriction-modification system R (restriction) subunit